jgi:hypothetical protein
MQLRNAGLSYQSAQSLNRILEDLPSGPKWECVPIEIDGFRPEEPAFLYKRNAVECVQYLLNNPLFVDHMNFVPVQHFTADGSQVFSEPVSGLQAWETQVRFHTRGVSLLTLNFLV